MHIFPTCLPRTATHSRLPTSVPPAALAVISQRAEAWQQLGALSLGTTAQPSPGAAPRLPDQQPGPAPIPAIPAAGLAGPQRLAAWRRQHGASSRCRRPHSFLPDAHALPLNRRLLHPDAHATRSPPRELEQQADEAAGSPSWEPHAQRRSSCRVQTSSSGKAQPATEGTRRRSARERCRPRRLSAAHAACCVPLAVRLALALLPPLLLLVVLVDDALQGAASGEGGEPASPGGQQGWCCAVVLLYAGLAYAKPVWHIGMALDALYLLLVAGACLSCMLSSGGPCRGNLARRWARAGNPRVCTLHRHQPVGRDTCQHWPSLPLRRVHCRRSPTPLACPAGSGGAAGLPPAVGCHCPRLCRQGCESRGAC